MLTDADRRPFVVRSEKLREEHMKRYPDYKYRPKKKKEIKEPKVPTPILPNPNQGLVKLGVKPEDKNNKIIPVTFIEKAPEKIIPEPIYIVANRNPTTVINQDISRLERHQQSLPNLKIKNTDTLFPVSPAKTFLTLTREVGKIGSLSSSGDGISISPKKMYETVNPVVNPVKRVRTDHPLTPPPSVPDNVGSPVDSENNRSFYDEIEPEPKKARNESNSSEEFQAAPFTDWLNEDWQDMDSHGSPFDDISIPDDNENDFDNFQTTFNFQNIYTTPEVSELINTQWLDSTLGF